MLYVCSDCGVIAKGDGRVVRKSIVEKSKCVQGLHAWKFTTDSRLSKTAEKAVNAYLANQEKQAAKV